MEALCCRIEEDDRRKYSTDSLQSSPLLLCLRSCFSVYIKVHAKAAPPTRVIIPLLGLLCFLRPLILMVYLLDENLFSLCFSTCKRMLSHFSIRLMWLRNIRELNTRLTFTTTCERKGRALLKTRPCYVTQQVGLAATGPHIGILFLLCRPFSTTVHTHTHTHLLTMSNTVGSVSSLVC